MLKVLPVAGALLTFVFAGLALAQNPPEGGAVVGGIVRTAEGTSLSSAFVMLRRSSDTIPVARSHTVANGAFRVEAVAPGSYVVEVSHLGYETATRNVNITDPTERVDLGIIRLEPSAIALQEVSVTAARSPIVMLPDRNVYSTADMPAAVGGTATDVLRSVPELEVGVDGRVTAQGATPMIHINGRPAPMQGEALNRYLQQLPAERIDRIEVISNPSARYEAHGQGGIINIVMKRGVILGLSGNVALNLGTRAQRGGSGSISYQRGRLTLLGATSASFFGNDFETSDYRENLTSQPSNFLQQDSRSRSSGRFASVDVSAEMQAGSHGAFWTDLGIGRSSIYSDVSTAYTHFDHLQNATERYDRVNDADLRGIFGSAVIGYRYTAGPQREASVEIRRNFSGDDNALASERQWLDLEGRMVDQPHERVSGAAGEDQNALSLEADLMQPWGSHGQIEVGYRGSWRSTDDHFRMQLNSPESWSGTSELGGAFDHSETVHAGFITVSQRVSRFRVQIGMRAEQAGVRTALPLDGESYRSRYRSLFPNANVTTGIDSRTQLRLSYSKRVERPEAWILNPHTPDLDPLNRQVGNPHLLPEYTHAFSFGLSRTGDYGTLQLSPFYRRTVGSWDQVRAVNEAGGSTLSWQNLSTVTSYGGRLSASLRPLGMIGGFASVSGYREVRNAGELAEEPSRAATRFSVSGNATIRPTAALNLQASLSYLPARRVAQGTISPLVFSTVGARLRLAGAGAVNVSVVDPFNLQRLRFTTQDQNHLQTGRSTLSARRATISVSYSFGRPPDSNRRERTPEETEQQRPVQRIR